MTSSVEAIFVFVDDGSTDSTRSRLQRASERSNVDCVFLDVNVGKGEAVRAGIRFALDAYPEHDVGFLDADGAFSIEDVRRFIELWRAYEGVLDGVDSLWSSRVALSGRQIQRSLRRHYVGRVIATVTTAGLPLPPYDTQAGFKIFASDEEVLHRCVAEPFSTRWFFDIELIQRWRSCSGRQIRIWEEPLTYWKDVDGSTIGFRSAPSVLLEVGRVLVSNLKGR